MSRLRRFLNRALEQTASLWPTIRQGFDWVERATTILGNEAGLAGAAVRHRYQGLLGAIVSHAPSDGWLSQALAHFVKVTRSYAAGLFACYDVAELPRTNNDLEQFFGSYRYHHRRSSGRRTACPGMVVRGSVRLVASAATRLREIQPADLIPSDLSQWRALRHRLERCQSSRSQSRRFRRDPAAYLQSLEYTLINQALPP